MDDEEGKKGQAEKTYTSIVELAINTVGRREWRRRGEEG